MNTDTFPNLSHDLLAEAIRKAAHPLRGAADDYDPLLKLIGDARFVLIGEASHGTHEFYRERAQITKRLIREKGFNAVAVEADWPDAYRINRSGVIPKCGHAALRLDCFLVDVCVTSSASSSSSFNSERHSGGVQRQSVRRSLAIASRVCSTISSQRPDTTAARSWNTASALSSVQ